MISALSTIVLRFSFFYKTNKSITERDNFRSKIRISKKIQTKLLKSVNKKVKKFSLEPLKIHSIFYRSVKLLHNQLKIIKSCIFKKIGCLSTSYQVQQFMNERLVSILLSYYLVTFKGNQVNLPQISLKSFIFTKK